MWLIFGVDFFPPVGEIADPAIVLRSTEISPKVPSDLLISSATYRTSSSTTNSLEFLHIGIHTNLRGQSMNAVCTHQ